MTLTPGLYLASSGSYPRTGDAPEFQTLTRTLDAFNRGERSVADVVDAENDVMRRVIAEQVQAGVEIVTDGQVRWRDPISHLAAKLENIRLEGSCEFPGLPGSGVQFRQPIFSGKPARKSALVLDDYNFARNALGRLPTPRPLAGKLKIKPVLTGPYTLAQCSVIDESGGSDGAAARSMVALFASVEARAMAYAEVLAAEVVALAEAGADLIQIDESAPIQRPQDWLILKKSVALLVEARNSSAKAGRGCDLALHICFQDCAALYEKVVSLPLDVIGLDFTCSPKLADVIAASGSPKTLALGLVDGRSRELENPEAVARQIERILPKIEGGRAYFTPSCGLAHLPHERAFAKLELLAKIRSAITVESAHATNG